MNYSQAESYLYDLRLYGTKLGLNNIACLLDKLDNPQKNLFFVHVAGTNGKGSLCSILNSILRAAGLKTAVFTSPHLISLRERFVVDNRVISAANFVSVLKRVKTACGELKKSDINPTFFEVVTAMAIDYFSREKVDAVILETGMGGSLDATNIVKSDISVITNVSLDHCKYLGDTVAEIAADKAGIIKNNQVFLTASDDNEVLDIFQKICDNKNTQMLVSDDKKHIRLTKRSPYEIKFDYIADKVCYKDLRSRLIAPYQLKNISLSVLAARTVFKTKNIPAENFEIYVQKGLEKASVKGRFQFIFRKPPVIVDAAHNIAGFSVLKTAVKKCFKDYKVCVMIGLLEDKDYGSVCRDIPSFADEIICVEPDSGRKLSCVDLEQCLRKYAPENMKISSSFNPAESVNSFINKNNFGSKKVLIVCGSFYLVGGILRDMGVTRLKIADKESDYR